MAEEVQEKRVQVYWHHEDQKLVSFSKMLWKALNTTCKEENVLYTTNPIIIMH